MTLSNVIIWIITGAIAGTLAGRIVTLSRKGLGVWTHLGIGMIGAVVGGGIFWALGLDLRLGEIRINAQDLLAALTGALLCILAWRLYCKHAESRAQKAKPQPDQLQPGKP